MISKSLDQRPQVLIIDDEPEVCDLTSNILDKVIGELERNSGTQFDPRLAELMIEFLKTTPDKIHYPC